MRTAYTVREVAHLFSVDRSTVYRDIEETGTVSGVEVVRVSQRIRIPVAPINAKLAINQRQAEQRLATMKRYKTA